MPILYWQDTHGEFQFPYIFVKSFSLINFRVKAAIQIVNEVKIKFRRHFFMKTKINPGAKYFSIFLYLLFEKFWGEKWFQRKTNSFYERFRYFYDCLKNNFIFRFVCLHNLESEEFAVGLRIHWIFLRQNFLSRIRVIFKLIVSFSQQQYFLLCFRIPNMKIITNGVFSKVSFSFMWKLISDSKSAASRTKFLIYMTTLKVKNWLRPFFCFSSSHLNKFEPHEAQFQVYYHLKVNLHLPFVIPT